MDVPDPAPFPLDMPNSAVRLQESDDGVSDFILSDGDDADPNLPPLPHDIKLATVGVAVFPSAVRQDIVLENLQRVQALYARATVYRPYWLPSLSGHHPQLRSLVIAGLRLPHDQEYTILLHDTDFLSSCPQLTDLTIQSINLGWETWRAPPSLESLSIEYSRFQPPGWPPLAPDYDPGASCPSLHSIIRIINPLQHLTTLSLSGCFPHTPSGTIQHLNPMHMPALQFLGLAGDGDSIEALCRSFVAPNLASFHIATRKWSSLRHLHLLTDQLQLDPAMDFVPIVYAGDMDGGQKDSIGVEFIEKDTKNIRIMLEAYGPDAAWGDMLNNATFPRFDTIIIKDHCSSYSPRIPSPSGSITWSNVMRAYPRVDRVVLVDGAGWAFAMLEALERLGRDLWIDLDVLSFRLPLAVNDNEKVAFGQWQYTLMGMKRSFLVTLNGELLTRQRVEEFIVNLHPEAVRGQFGWLAELPS